MAVFSAIFFSSMAFFFCEPFVFLQCACFFLQEHAAADEFGEDDNETEKSFT